MIDDEGDRDAVFPGKTLYAVWSCKPVLDGHVLHDVGDVLADIIQHVQMSRNDVMTNNK
jgi:hypothetical protein